MIGPIPITSPVRTVLDLAAVAAQKAARTGDRGRLRRRLFTSTQLADRFVTYARPGSEASGSLRPLVDERVGAHVPTGSDFELKSVG